VASIQGHFDPWHPRLLERSEAQLDLILEAYSADHPKELRFERNRTRREKERPLDILKGWADVLMGNAKDALLNQVAFKIPDRFRQTGPIRLPPNAIPPATAPALPDPRKSNSPVIAPRLAPRRR
jgi:hypothetical protein